jgi:hypothetical protein
LPEVAVCGTYFGMKVRTTGPSADPIPTPHSKSRQPGSWLNAVLSFRTRNRQTSEEGIHVYYGKSIETYVERLLGKRLALIPIAR